MHKALWIPIIIGGVLGTAVVVGGTLFGVSAIMNAAIPKKIETHDLGLVTPLQSFKFALTTSDVAFKVAEDGNARIECRESEKVYHTVENSGGTLTITQVNKKSWIENLADFGYDYRVTVYLPAGIYNAMDFQCTTGNLSIPEGFVFSSMKAKSTTGNLSLSCGVLGEAELKNTTGNILVDKMSPSSLNASVSTGNITLKNGTVGGALKTSSSTGNTRLENMEADSFDAHASTGNITFSHSVCSGQLKAETSTGNVRFDEADCDTMKVKTSTGNVTGVLLSPKIFYATTSTGKVNVPHSTEGGLAEISTSTGNITITIKE